MLTGSAPLDRLGGRLALLRKQKAERQGKK